jgi:hypothetical protein
LSESAWTVGCPHEKDRALGVEARLLRDLQEISSCYFGREAFVAAGVLAA